MIWLNRVICLLIRRVLALRYRIRLKGAEEIIRRGAGGILFLPNHPALIDPLIVFTRLYPRFTPRFLADRDQVSAPVVRQAAGMAGVITLPDVAKHGPAVAAEVDASLRECAATLRAGRNLVLYPAGRIYRSRHEDLCGNTGVDRLLRECPGVRVVLVRTRGLWGSRFGFAGGAPQPGAVLRRAPLWLLLNGLFFGPRRTVSIELVEPETLPAEAEARNRAMEAFYNEDAPPNTYVPATIWERGGTRVLPEPAGAVTGAGDLEVPPDTRRIVQEHLAKLSGKKEIADAALLAKDLGLDSLARTELLVWLGKEFGPQAAAGNAETLQSVADVLRAACGEASTAPATARLKPVPPAWFAAETDQGLLEMPDGATIPDLFLRRAAGQPGRVLVADQTRGAATGRDLVTGVFVLRPLITRLPGERVGIMLPASVTADLVFLAALFAGKTPVMVNWTVGAGVMRASLDLIGVRHVITSSQLLAKLRGMGTDLAPVAERFACLEEWIKSVPFTARLLAALRARFSWGPLRRAEIPRVAAILFTSGSEALPKAVPLTHANLLANLRAVVSYVGLRRNDSMLGMLPPFHSFGLTVTTVAPLCLGMRVVHHPNPHDAAGLAAIIAAYRVTLLLGTPTFLNGIAGAAAPEQLRTLRLAVTGAEKCPDRVYALLRERCPQTVVLEGYGITECSPIVAANHPDHSRPGTIGRVLPNLEWVIVDEAQEKALPPGETGMLLVRGPSIFEGYLNYDGRPPFVEFAGRQWYQTGDLVSADADGVITFRGRKKRFVKIGGEMVSLPAIEEALEKALPPDPAGNDGPRLAVQATKDEARPELVLFTTLSLERAAVNDLLAAAGLSPIHNLRRVVRLDALPVLGTGKTDYRALEKQLADAPRETPPAA